MESILKSPYAQWPAAELLDYFRGRSTVRNFAVLDDEQTSRAKIDDVLINRFSFNGASYQLAAPIDWQTNPSRDLEWLILLHKFYYVAGLGAAYQESRDPRYGEKWIELTSSWIDSVPLGFLPSDVAGRRIQNWIFAHYYFVSPAASLDIPPEFYRRYMTSIAAQVNYLCEHLTPARNHRTLELAAVFLAAVVFPEFADAERWLDLSKRELLENIQADLLPDGVHCELSTDYHHLVLKNYLWVRRLAALNGIPMPEEIDALIRKALEFALYVHKPDGSIPSLSDGDSRSFLDLLERGYELYGDETMLYVASRGAKGLPPAHRSKAFPDAGYYVLRSGWGDGADAYQDERYLIFDCGPLGRGNHGHFDLLSFEMAAYGHSMIVDPGRYTYDESGAENWRARFRGTGYHNTVQVDGLNQTRYEFHKTKFKITGREPEWQLCEWQSGANYDYLRGIARSHEYDAVHERRIFFWAPEYWIVSDILTAREIHDYDLRFHLSHEALNQTSISHAANTLLADAPQLVIAQAADAEVKLFVDEGYVSRTYGVKHAAPVLRFAQRGADTVFHSVLYPFKTVRPQIRVEVLPVWRGARRCDPTEALALSITLTRGEQQFHDYYFSAEPNQRRDYSFGSFSYNGSLLFLRAAPSGRIIDIRLKPDAELIENGQARACAGY